MGAEDSGCASQGKETISGHCGQESPQDYRRKAEPAMPGDGIGRELDLGYATGRQWY